MPKKTTPSSPKSTQTKAVKTEKKIIAKKSTEWSDLKSLRADLFSLKMKHALRELKEVHKIRQARKAVARHLTQLNKSK